MNSLTNNNLKRDICFITARGDYAINGLKNLGIEYYRPYIEKNFLNKMFRRIWYKLGLKEEIWYDKKILNKCYKYIIVEDPLISKKYLLWLIKKCPNSKIAFFYGNLIGKAKHLLPSDIPKGISVWTYDYGDAEKYKLNINKIGGFGYYTSYIGKNKEKKYDIVYVGADKGRGEYIIDLEKKFNEMGFKTHFIITKNGLLAKNKKFYKNKILYKDVVELDNSSKSILNITIENQIGPTLRDYESMYNEIKLITNNKNVKKLDFYNKNNIFIIGEDSYDDLKKFINTSYEKLDSKILERHSFENAIYEIISKL